MALILFAAFLAVPVIEIGLFIELGGFLGLWPTLGLVVLTAVVGTSLLRQQGGATLAKAQVNLQQGIIPLKEVFDAICLLVAGALLLTPGFLTDGLGASLLLPPVREILRNWLGKKFGPHIQTPHQANPFHQAGQWANTPTGFDDPMQPGQQADDLDWQDASHSSPNPQPRSDKDGVVLRTETTDIEFTIVQEATDSLPKGDARDDVRDESVKKDA